MGTFRETREVERELANDYGFDADRTVEVDEGDLELRDMTRDSRSITFYDQSVATHDISSVCNGV